MLKTKQCPRCDNLMWLGLTDYKTEIYNREVIINDIEGYQCPNCQYVEPTENMESYLEEKMLEKRLELLKALNMKPIYISNLKQIRNKKGLSQKQVADALGVAEQRFSAIERNVNTPIILIAYTLAHYFDVSADELYNLIYIPEKIYDQLLNSEIIRDGTGATTISYIKEIDKTRNELNKIRNEIDDINNELRQYRLKLKKEMIKKEKAERDMGVLKNRKENKLNPAKKKLEKTMETLERNHDLIIKQNHIIAREDWNEIEKCYKEESEEFING